MDSATLGVAMQQKANDATQLVSLFIFYCLLILCCCRKLQPACNVASNLCALAALAAVVNG